MCLNVATLSVWRKRLDQGPLSQEGVSVRDHERFRRKIEFKLGKVGKVQMQDICPGNHRSIIFLKMVKTNVKKRVRK